MADYTVTAANVIASGTATIRTGVAGVTISAGQPLYADASASNVMKLADADTSAATATFAGIALHGALAGQPITYVTADDDFTHGLGTVITGDIIILSGNVGALCPAADLSSGEYPVVVMVAKSATRAHLKVIQGSAAKA